MRTIDKKRMNLGFGATFSEIKDLNPNFASGKMRIAYAGRNRNMSDISKEVFESAIPSMFNCPIVARYDRDTDEFGSHDIEVVVKDHSINIINATVPLGLIPNDANWYWENFEEEDGTQHEYLIVDVLFWKRQEACQYLLNQGYADQSMECDFLEYHYDDDGYCVADKICFSAFCLLGNAEPCFESAGVQVFAKDNFINQFSIMIDELKECADEQLKGLSFDTNFKNKGGKSVILTEEIKENILNEFSVSIEDINFEITEDMTEEDFRIKVSEFKESISQKQDTTNSDEPDAESTIFNKFSTYGQKRDAIQNALEPVTIRNGDGEVVSETHYWLVDFDDQYAYVERYTYSDTDYQDDNGRFKYTYDDDALTASVSGDFELMVLKWLTIEESQKLEDSRSIFEELAQFKKDRLKDDHDKNVIEALSNFEDIYDTKEFADFLEKAFDIEEIEDIKTQCFAIRGKHVNFENQPKDNTPKIPLAKSHVTQSRYGDLFDVYSKK